MAKRSQVEWEEPPPARVKRYDWGEIAEQLRARPGEWAKVFENDKTSLVTAIRLNNIKPLRSTKGFETRTTDNTRTSPRYCTLYMRYVPENDTEREE